MIGSLGTGAPPFIDLVGVRPISRIGTRTPAWVPVTKIFREAGKGCVGNGRRMFVLWPLPSAPSCTHRNDPFSGS